ncbi:MAG: hypothetical protein AVDCRST_MAG77-17 [uncultured Chloroflexi bacterium]|uniref:DUF4396 domain-containing protein n=1 Tax=uncultured Chloroflexota bacterium TaxID=166587 RepID=A0A6J4H3C6_9CHLR|nr:MAG: hypothetical protein AVDCRST_MAG77-17 [uncultured Chloroflexota bacterium]
MIAPADRAGVPSHASHERSGPQVGHSGHAGLPSLNAVALRATLHCLAGCGVGEVLGLVIGTALGWHMAPAMALAIVLAFVFGYSFSVWPLVAGGLPFRSALSLALASDTLSIVTMEVVDNGILLLIPGAMHAGLGDGLFWGSLAVSLAVAFAATYLVNRWLIARGRGHALVHAHHSQ